MYIGLSDVIQFWNDNLNYVGNRECGKACELMQLSPVWLSCQPNDAAGLICLLHATRTVMYQVFQSLATHSHVLVLTLASFFLDVIPAFTGAFPWAK